jgi:hypothetical protein
LVASCEQTSIESMDGNLLVGVEGSQTENSFTIPIINPRRTPGGW